MARFSTRSKSRLNTCDKKLIELFEEVVKGFDCTIIEGHRGQKKQDEAYNKGNSKVISLVSLSFANDTTLDDFNVL